MAGWVFSLSTLHPAGSFLRQSSWLYMLAITVPGILLALRLPRQSATPAEEGYEAVPMLEIEGRDGALGKGRGDLQGP